MTENEKKGLSPWAWVAIGCGGLLVLFAIVVTMSGMFVAKKVGDYAEEFKENPAAAAELLIKMNPELELVDSDREAGTMTIRNKEDGEVITVNYEDIEQGQAELRDRRRRGVVQRHWGLGRGPVDRDQGR